MSRFTAPDTDDVRFPASSSLDGSEAMNPDPDCSAAYIRLRTDADGGLTLAESIEAYRHRVDA